MSDSQNMRSFINLTEGKVNEANDWRQDARLQANKEMLSDPDLRQAVKDGLAEMLMGLDGPNITVPDDAVDQLVEDEDFVSGVIKAMVRHGIR